MSIKPIDSLGPICSLKQLTKALGFTYLPQIAFETPLDCAEIKKRVALKRKQELVTPELKWLESRCKDKIRLGVLSPVSIGWVSEEVGYGLFAAKDIPAGSYVGEYTGIIRKNDLRRCFEPLNDYCALYPVEDELSKRLFLDAKQFGNLTRFINHSNTPNLEVRHLFCDGFYHRVFIANRLIRKREQLLYSYGKNYWYARKPPLEINLDESSLKEVFFHDLVEFDKGHFS